MMVNNNLSLLGCPNCRRPLLLNGDIVRCNICELQWNVDEYEVIRFLHSDAPFGFGSRMPRLLDEMRQMTAQQFFQSIARLERDYPAFEFDYAINPARAAWTVLGDFENTILVDLGCGFGAVALALAPKARIVVCVDASLERLHFLALMAGFHGADNIVAVHADAFRLPLVPNTVDRFIVVGLLEWVGTRDKTQAPEVLQRQLLCDIRMLLKDDGELWLGVDNRVNPLYFFGRTHHGDPPFTPLLPRSLANAVSRTLRGCDYRTYTYTPWGYRQLLHNAGYREVEIFYAFPDYKIPETITTETGIQIDIGGRVSGSLSQIHRLANWAYPWLLRLGLEGVFAPALFLRASP